MTTDKIAALEEAYRKLSHTGHRVHFLMHPNDKPYFQEILKAARAHLEQLRRGDSSELLQRE